MGSHVCERLVKLGHKVTVLDDLSSGKLEYLPGGIDTIKANLLDVDEYYNDLPDLDAVIHLAAQTSVSKSVKDPLLDFRNNALGTATVLEIARKKDVKDFRLTSSAAVYGNAENLPIPESASTFPLSMYGFSKLTSENLAIMYSRQNGINGAIYRPSNIYGPRQRNDLEGGVVSIFAKAALSGSKALIYGDGKQTRDFIFVEDVAKYICHELGQRTSFDMVNLSTGKPFPIINLWKTVCSISGADAGNVEFRPPRSGDIYHSTLSNEKLMKIFGNIRFASLESGITKTVDYFRTHL